MKKTGIFYGTNTGTTEDVAHRIAKELGVADADIHNVADTAPDVLGDYDVIVIGTPTWGSGEIQEDFYDFLDGAQVLDLKGHKIALFGLGDESMYDTFCNGLGTLYDKLKDTGADFVAVPDAKPYHYAHSTALRDGHFVGMVLDEQNHPELTDARIASFALAVESL